VAKTSTSSSKSSAKTMAELMSSSKTSFISPKKGEILEGTITKLSSSEILVDIGTKTQAVVLEKDKKILRSLLEGLKEGDKVGVQVLNPESEHGNTVVSLRRFNEDKMWQRLETLLKAKEKVDAVIDASTKGGFIVTTSDGASGFLPNSQVSLLPQNENLTGKTIKVSVIELSRPLKKVIFSQKAAIDTVEFERAAKNHKRGDKVISKIASVAPFGIFTLIGENLEGFIHVSEISWEQLESVPEQYKVGDEIEAVVLGTEKSAKRINLSIKRMSQNPHEEKLKQFSADTKVEGTVDLGEGIEGVIKKEKIPPTVSFASGQNIQATVLEVDRSGKVILAPVLKEKPIGYR
jgi:small subunit ribosomal protein S1